MIQRVDGSGKVWTIDPTKETYTSTNLNIEKVIATGVITSTLLETNKVDSYYDSVQAYDYKTVTTETPGQSYKFVDVYINSNSNWVSAYQMRNFGGYKDKLTSSATITRYTGQGS